VTLVQYIKCDACGHTYAGPGFSTKPNYREEMFALGNGRHQCAACFARPLSEQAPEVAAIAAKTDRSGDFDGSWDLK
jgi:hypothetical protein